MWNKNNLSLVKINKITPELHLIQDLRHQFLSQDIQQTKDTFSKHTLWDKRGVTGEGIHSAFLFSSKMHKLRNILVSQPETHQEM